MAAPVTEATRTGTPVLEVCNIDKRYGGVHALKDVSWKVYPGEVCGLVGENGAGKPTLIKMISGAESPDTDGPRRRQRVSPWGYESRARSGCFGRLSGATTVR